MLGSCVVIPPIFFKAEVASLKAQAARQFPPGSSAAEFEAWFAEKRCGDAPSCKVGGGQASGDEHVYFHGDTPSKRKIELAKQCEMRSMELTRIEGCVNLLIANYCVDGAGKLMLLEFEKGPGYC